MDEYDKAWAENKPSKSKYRENETFENNYLNLVNRKSDNFSSSWEILGQRKLKTYKFNNQFEHEYFCESGIDGFDDVWGSISLCCLDDSYMENEIFDQEVTSLVFEAMFKYNSQLKTLAKYKTCNRFEDCFNQITQKEISQTINLKENKKVPQKKSEKSQHLKNLLDIRLKRLKQMSDHIETLKNENNKTVYKCKLCSVESLRKRKLYVGHVIPAHLSASKPKPPRRKNKRKVKIQSVVFNQFICSDLYCSKRFTTRRARKRHMLISHKRLFSFECESCSKSFRDGYDLFRHRRSNHKVAPVQLKCVLCTSQWPLTPPSKIFC